MRNTLESLIAEIEENGWRVNSLHHLSDLSWIASIRKPDSIFSSGFGSTAFDALASAISDAGERGQPPSPITYSLAPDARPEPALNFDEFIGKPKIILNIKF